MFASLRKHPPSGVAYRSAQRKPLPRPDAFPSSVPPCQAASPRSLATAGRATSPIFSRVSFSIQFCPPSRVALSTTHSPVLHTEAAGVPQPRRTQTPRASFWRGAPAVPPDEAAPFPRHLPRPICPTRSKPAPGLTARSPLTLFPEPPFTRPSTCPRRRQWLRALHLARAHLLPATDSSPGHPLPRAPRRRHPSSLSPGLNSLTHGAISQDHDLPVAHQRHGTVAREERRGSCRRWEPLGGRAER